MDTIPSDLLQFFRGFTKATITLDPTKGEVIRKNKPKKVKPYTERTRSITRTRSLRQFAGSRALKRKPGSKKRRDHFPMLSGNGGQRTYPMGLNASSNFIDIETLFHSSALHRSMSGRPPLATYYK